jgi:heterodisulfide reductase subunit D
MARDLFDGKYALTPSVRDKIYACTLCGNCSVQCQQLIGEHHQEIFEALREECAEAGLLYPQHQAIQTNERNVHNPYGDPQDSRFTGIEEKYFKTNADVLFFVGCTTALRNKTFFHDILDVLDKLNVNFTLSKEEWCCGSPLLTTGQKNEAKALADHNAEMIAKLGVKTIVTACSGCYRTLKRQYPEKFGLLNSEAVKIEHLSEYISGLLKKMQFSSSKEPIAVTYHDPCHLGRHVGIYDAPRKILKSLPGVKFIEMPRNKENAWCCGAGAGVKSAYKDWAVEIAENRVQEALDLKKTTKTPIKYLVSACPFCERNLADAVEKLQQANIPDADQIEIIDLVQLVKKFLK